MQTSPVPLLAENLPQQLYLEAIFRSLTDLGKLEIRSGLGRDSALAMAESFMLVHPDRRVAIVLETNSRDPEAIREYDRAARRRLSLTDASGESWHLALAVPRLDAWALTDDHVRRQFAKNRQRDPDSVKSKKSRDAIESGDYLDLAARIQSLVSSKPFDLENLKRKSRQCSELCEFIEHSFEPASLPATVAEWF